MSDPLVLLAGLLLLWVPGSLLVALCRVRSGWAYLGAAPVATVGVLQIAASLGAVTTVGLPVAALALTVALLVATVVMTVRRGLPRMRRPTLAAAAGGVLAAAAAGLGLSTWIAGLHGLATPPQEHDTVLHSELVAYIARTGRAAPWQVMPVDLATGTPVRFYPAGMHTVAGLLARVSPNPVVALNATTALLLGVVAPLVLFAAVSLCEPVNTRGAFAGLAALAAVLLYRPVFNLAHDAGIISYAAALGAGPALLVGVLLLRRRHVGSAVLLAVLALSVLTLHPSLLVIVALSAVVFAITGLFRQAVREWVWERIGVLGGAAVLAAVLAAPWLIAGAGVVDSTADYPELPPLDPVSVMLSRTVGFSYGGFFDPTWSRSQSGFAVIFWAGALGCVLAPRLRPLLAVWGFWAAIGVLLASGHSKLPVVSQVGALFYNSFSRLFDIGWVIAPAVAGLGIGALLALLQRVRFLSVRWLPPLTAAVVALLFMVGAGLGYHDENVKAVAQRYGDPAFIRVSAAEVKGFDYLASQEPDVGRVLNNANDGSTFAYVYDGIDVVNTYPIGMPEARYGIYLMQHVNELGRNPKVACLLRRWDITHVFVSLTSPPIGALAAPFHWVRSPLFSQPKGFADLQDTSGLKLVFSNKDTSIYRVNPQVRADADLSACSADPAAP